MAVRLLGRTPSILEMTDISPISSETACVLRQCFSSRSARISSLRLRLPRESRGWGGFFQACVAALTGTMSATGRPLRYTRTVSPSSTASKKVLAWFLSLVRVVLRMPPFSQTRKAPVHRSVHAKPSPSHSGAFPSIRGPSRPFGGNPRQRGARRLATTYRRFAMEPSASPPNSALSPRNPSTSPRNGFAFSRKLSATPRCWSAAVRELSEPSHNLSTAARKLLEPPRYRLAAVRKLSAPLRYRSAAVRRLSASLRNLSATARKLSEPLYYLLAAAHKLSARRRVSASCRREPISFRAPPTGYRESP